MATKKMLVDATHPEETRIVVTSGNKLEDFDFESAERRQLRGNIYLAKVTRVEPSLQAAFVEYGGNRHGFLAFSEIHPDYYQIPVADREALMRDEEEAQAEQAAADLHETSVAEDIDEGDPAEDDEGSDSSENGNDGNGRGKKVEQLGDGDALEDLQVRPRHRSRQYKIQEVIKRRQVLLVQVVKEERGNKGAALTTYLSLAGRYSVLMPNTARGGGISRKITSATDRKRLKEIASGLDVPKGMGVILRTAGASRTKAEVKRDFEYLMRLWENVRTLTLDSSAPSLVYEEGSLIKRTIRDLYNKDIGEVLVAGDAAYREAKDFMRMIMPSHSKNVQAYKGDVPIFSKSGVEAQLDSMFHPQVTLPSGGYIVINPTEALVSIDVNSGRATKEHNIEDTALQTNLEASEEISRQLRLRDLAGLIVIDFIDMEEKRNNRSVERKLKDCLKNDRARIQVGHISHFGLMEMSRQRIRFGVLESSTHACATCAGTGLVRSVSSLALMIMRAIEDHVLRKPGQSINVRMPAEAALYILNTKRMILMDLERRYGLSITVSADSGLVGSQFHIEKGEARAPEADLAAGPIRADAATMADYDREPEDEPEAEAESEPEVEDAGAGDSGGRKRRRRRRRGGAESQQSDTRAAQQEVEGKAEDTDTDTEEVAEPHSQQAQSDDEDDQPRKRRRRGRRGGRRNRRPQDNEQTAQGADATDPDAQTEDVSDADARAAVEDVTAQDDTPPSDPAETVEPPMEQQAEEQQAEAEPAPEKPKRARRSRKSPAKKAAETEASAEPAGEDADAAPAASEQALEAEVEASEDKPKRKTRTPRKRTSKAKKSETATEEAKSAVSEVEKAPEAAPVARDASSEQDSQPAEAPVTRAPEADGAVDGARQSADASEPARDTPDTGEEDIVVSSSGDEDKKPKKVGWWQRGFFG